MKVLGLLVVLPILVGFTDAAVDSWKINSETAVTGNPDANLAVTLAETTDTSTTLFSVTALDGSSAAVSSYEIIAQDNAGQFELGASAGQVKLAASQVLDYEAGTSVTIQIRAVDSSSASGTATVAITITDVNDNSPVFSAPASSPHSVEIADGSTAGTALYTVTATDADGTGNTVTYSISSGNTNTDFAIGQTTGAITVATGQTLAKATTASYALVIHATDSGSPVNTGTATLSVTVCDPCSNGTGKHAPGFLSFIIALFMCVKKLM